MSTIHIAQVTSAPINAMADYVEAKRIAGDADWLLPEFPDKHTWTSSFDGITRSYCGVNRQQAIRLVAWAGGDASVFLDSLTVDEQVIFDGFTERFVP